MAGVGPQLPHSLAEKRKRREEQGEDDNSSDSTSTKHSHSSHSSIKRQRVLGPSSPPADLNQRPTTGPDSEPETSSADDDFGPSLPSATDTRISEKAEHTNDPPSSALLQTSAKRHRDEWMIVPPSNTDWSSRVDPTKLRNRKFNTGKGARGPSQATVSEDAKWTESPAEKNARLEREMMGIKDTPKTTNAAKHGPRSETASKKLGAYTEKSRGPTLYKEHQKSNPSEKEDDPSARAFDRDKDIAGGMKINHTLRKEMMKKASDFGSRFSSGKYL